MNYLTFDIDWASDAILQETVSLLKKYNAKATFFATHLSPFIKELEKDSDFEIGLHPNFNNLLNGCDKDNKNYQQVVDELKAIYPDALGVRSHSLTQSSSILEAFISAGLKYDVNLFLPYHDQIKPHKAWNDLVRIIYNWEDDVHWIYKKSFDDLDINLGNELNIFDFHPVHIYLNTDCAQSYEKSRDHHRDPSQLHTCRNRTNPGAKDALVYLLEQVPFTETLFDICKRINTE